MSSNLTRGTSFRILAANLRIIAHGVLGSNPKHGSCYAPIVKWLLQHFGKVQLQVRFLLGAPSQCRM